MLTYSNNLHFSNSIYIGMVDTCAFMCDIHSFNLQSLLNKID